MKAFSPLTLPNGTEIKNRFVKAAMEENMAEDNQLPGTALKNLYAAWAKGGVGMIITGNVMVDKMAMTGPGGVALEADTPIQPFKEWAEIAKQNNTTVIMQINHPGRQVFKKMGGKVLSPSNIALNMGKHSGLFTQPKAMSEAEIEDVIARFVTTAKRAEEAGFHGVEIHAAHGYLVSQFLSPLTNVRKDEWGGELQARAKILFDIVRQVKSSCGKDFIVSVKLNSADFQRGGFDVEDAIEVVKSLNDMGLDFIELSGGSYEAPAMQGKSGDQRTLAREAYFLTFAKQIAEHTSIPVMTTGGIKRLSVANEVLDSNMELVGIASALAYNPALINQWHVDQDTMGYIPATAWKDKTLSGLANMALVKRQLRRLGKGDKPKVNSSPLMTLIIDQVRTAKLTKRYRKQYVE
ncbi:NADH:flavin oxidoreductase/NADH oxidase family protein [Brumicola nitratireducens]|uniref:NADH:flavin oxidoreductase/NADH oxidase n=1 Tax=Glaciecola nitratireducens (strain JCM 12485 / KCTC 12276 / FR1064) TaxID=1085623 RepID=G4QH98_GLANF|nr:NADH:flavin oxidoreductase/NADH oxidase family protein [Glaciecola nitratireducens]AEP29729.1 NADH:flavin oxidoreductase/NADH oxidase [Glaciecola nitratireducens FR1064]